MQLFSMLAASAEEFSASGPPACSFHPSPWLYKDLQITFPCVFSYHVVIFTEEGMGRKPIIPFILMSLSLLKTRGILIKSKASHTLFSKPSWILQFILKLKNTSLTMARRSHELKACFFPASSLSTLPLSLLLPRCLYYPSDMTVRLPPMGPLYLRSPVPWAAFMQLQSYCPFSFKSLLQRYPNKGHPKYLFNTIRKIYLRNWFKKVGFPEIINMSHSNPSFALLVQIKPDFHCWNTSLRESELL